MPLGGGFHQKRKRTRRQQSALHWVRWFARLKHLRDTVHQHAEVVRVLDGDIAERAVYSGTSLHTEGDQIFIDEAPQRESRRTESVLVLDQAQNRPANVLGPSRTHGFAAR